MDDTIPFMDHDLEKACNMKLLLCAFEQLSHPNINFLKVNHFALLKLRYKNHNTLSCFAVNWVIYNYNI